MSTVTEQYHNRKIDTTKPMLALTFDDGPGEHTDRLLDILKKHNAGATFFVVGNMIDNGIDTLKRTAFEGHEIGNHTWDHAQLIYLTPDEIEAQLTQTSEKICEVIGTAPHLSRPPYGSYNDAVKEMGEKLGLSFINWTVNTMDWQTQNAEAVYNEIMSTAEDGAIMLCHDSHGSTVDAMETVVPELIERGFQLVTVSQLMSYSEAPMKAGELYCRR